MTQVAFVGGPKNGEFYPTLTARWLNIPDARDMVNKVTPDGVVTLFGSHTYEMACYRMANGEKTYRLEYRGYKKPGAS
jgi:hypothetical protein